VPMASALWSSPSSRILAFPAKYLVQFMANHQMLQVSDRPQWRVVRGGSSRYIEAMRARWRVRERLCTPVRMLLRTGAGATVMTDDDAEHFDHVVVACHSDQALQLLGDASDAERSVLGAIAYQANDTVLHTDARLLPRNPKAWAAWNALVPRKADDVCTVSYCMNLLQGLDAPEPLIVTLNRTDRIDPSRILRRMRYQHPVYSHASVAAQTRRAEIQGQRHTWFAGAYWGWGFHEDGMRSAVDVANALGANWAPRGPAEADPVAADLRA
jgi:predicted NAD/FAD-binding protein